MNQGNHGISFCRIDKVVCAVAAVALILLLSGLGRRLFANTGIRWVHVGTVSFLASFVLVPFFIRIALRFGIVDQPDPRKTHSKPTPLLGGAAVFTGFFVAIIANGIYSSELSAILIACMPLLAVGVADDFMEIPAWVKLAAQVGCTAVVIASGIMLRVLPESLGLVSSAGNVFLTVFWIIGITNAMNFFDGMDGLAAGLSVIIAVFLGITAFITGQAFLGWAAAAIAGACLGFLPYNFRPKKRALIFLGDAGSTVAGFVLACIAVMGDWSENRPVVALVSPILIFWVLIFDMVHITVERILTGKVRTFKQWIDFVGRDHLHHRLERVLGGSVRSVFFIWLLSICLGISALVLRGAEAADAVLLIIQASIVVLLITVLERCGKNGCGETS